jgi:hypothetical protein
MISSLAKHIVSGDEARPPVSGHWLAALLFWQDQYSNFHNLLPPD